MNVYVENDKTALKMFFFFFHAQIAGGQLQVGEGGAAENNYENISKIQRCIAEGDLEFVSLVYQRWHK